LIARLHILLDKQPRRRLAFGIMIDCKIIEIIRIERNNGNRLYYRTGFLTLFNDNLTHGDGYQFLYNLLHSPISSLGYEPFVFPSLPIEFEQSNGNILSIQYLEMIHEGAWGRAHVCKGWYSARRRSLGGSVTEEKETIQKICVVKWCKNKDQIDTEVSILKNLTHSSIPIVLANGYINEETKAIITEPVGNSILNYKEINPTDLLKYIKQINSALKHAHEKKILHLDVSPKNVIISKNDDIAILIDWGIAASIGSTSFGITGTALFCSLGILLSGIQKQEYSVSPKDDFESLFYTFLQLLCGSKLPWTKAKNKTELYSLKKTAMYELWNSQIQPIIPQQAWTEIERIHKLLFIDDRSVSSLFE